MPKPTSDRSLTVQTLLLHWRYTRRYLPEFIIAAGGAVLAVIAQTMLPPYIIALIFKKLQYAYANDQALTFDMFIPHVIAFVACMIAGLILWRVQTYYVWRFELKVFRDMSNDIYNHLQSQSQRFHADRFGGALVSQANKLLGAYERLLDDLIWNILPSITTLVTAVGVLLFVAWQYAVVLVIVVIIYLVLMTRRVARQLPYNTINAAAESDQTAALADAITNMNTIRAFAGERYESKRFKKVTDQKHGAGERLMREAFKTDALSHTQTNSFHIIALVGGLLAVTNFGTNVSVLYLLVSYTQQIVNRVWEFSRLVRNVNRALGDSAEMTEILAIKPEIADPAQPAKVAMRRGEVTFKNVSFAYDEHKSQALFDGLNLTIKPGEKIGLVGPSGGGKTTITKLLLRFVDINGGVIAIDGQDISSVRQSDLRAHIAYVSQEPILFHRSLAENIGYGNHEADRRAIEGVAKLANAHEFISKLPESYDTFVGERGVKLSGGQRQRVAIARAMLKNAPILVLDEATSALDSESEVLIQDALWKLMEGRTAIVIAHRLSTIQKMDRIVVLDNGKIVEQGSHNELLGKQGTYASLWTHQSGGFISDEAEESRE
jgi:ATP-binding cassette, subfamily B, bacterial